MTVDAYVTDLFDLKFSGNYAYEGISLIKAKMLRTVSYS